MSALYLLKQHTPLAETAYGPSPGDGLPGPMMAGQRLEDMMQRDEVIKQIRTALKRRSGKAWSVTGGTGTAYGWITIDAPPAQRMWRHELPAGLVDLPQHYEDCNTNRPGGHSSPEARAELTQLLGLPRLVHFQGESIPAGYDYYEEYVARAEGKTPARCGKQYWD